MQVVSNSLIEKMSQYTIFTSIEDIKNIKSSKSINVKGDKISFEHLKRILFNEEYFNYVLNYFLGNSDKFVVANVFNNVIGHKIEHSKSNILLGLKSLLNNFSYDEEVLKKYSLLKEAISLEKYIEKYGDNDFLLEIEGEKYQTKIKNLIDVINLDEEKFNLLCEDKNITQIDNISKEYFLFMLKTFVEKNKMFDNYIVNENVKNNYFTLEDQQLIDLEAINKFLETTDKKYKNIKVNKDLENEIFKDMPSDLTTIEKAIYIYIKMCKTLSYDDEYYAVDQKGDAVEKHQNISYISNITLDNPKAVCYEFNIIYTKLLDDLGIKFKSSYQNVYGEAYGKSHVELDYRVGKYLVHADSVTSILGGDMVRTKLNQHIIGLSCDNKNFDTKKEFNELIKKVSDLILKPKEESLDELLREYKKLSANIQKIKAIDKFYILMDKINSSKIKGIDLYYYISEMKKIFFENDELKNNFSFNIIRNNLPIKEDQTASLAGIFSINNHSFSEFEDYNEYYLLNEEKNFYKTSKEEIEEKFETGEYDYIKKTDYGIPGIVNYRRKRC